MKNQNRLKLLNFIPPFFILLLSLWAVPFFVFAQSFTLHGEVRFEGKGTVFISLVDRESFRQPEKGIANQVFPPLAEGQENPETRTTRSFSFQDVPPGTYAIVGFLDTNGNSKLDTGLFGPTEPWGMSFRASRPLFRAPRFEEVSFTVPGEIRYFTIELR